MTDDSETPPEGVKPRRGRPPGSGGNLPRKQPGQRNKHSAATISRAIREMGLTSLNFVGGVKYLNRVAKTNPAAYLAFIAKLVKQDDGHAGDGNVTFIIQQLPPSGPVAGVLSSPIASHIAPPLKLISNGEVVSDE